MKKLRVLLADDHATVREGLRLIVSSQTDMEVVGEAGDGGTAISEAQRHLPDVVVMDVSMPGVNGLQATQILHETCPRVKIMMLTRHAETGYVKRLLSAGASGYVLKQGRAANLLQGIRAVAAGGTYIDSSMTSELLGDVHAANRSAVEHAKILSPREVEVLRLVASGHSNKDIAGRLDISVKTVETHKANAMHKLGMHSRIEVVRFALLQGWLDTD